MKIISMYQKRMEEKNCGNCQNRRGGFDGGFDGEPFTCECVVFGDTPNQKDCPSFERRITMATLFNENSELKERVKFLEEENARLRKDLQKKEEESEWVDFWVD